MENKTRSLLTRVPPSIAGAIIVAACGSGSNVTSSSSEQTSASDAVSGGSGTSARIALSAATYTFPASSKGQVTIYRTGSTAGAASVGFKTVDGTATAGIDYTASSGTVTWQDGDASPKSVIVAVTAQAAGKNFDISLTSIEGSASFGAPSSAVIDVEAAGSASGAVTLSWTAPTTNTNGSALTNLAGFDIHYGKSASAMTYRIAIGSVSVLSYVIDNLTSGTWYFEVFAVNSAGVQSGPSSLVHTAI
jgi:hypothetical protein